MQVGKRTRSNILRFWALPANLTNQCYLREAHLDLHGAGGQGGDLLLHTVSNTRVHGGTTRQHIVGIQVLTDINVALHDAVVCGLMDTGRLHT